jgi:hypothetical protein
MQCTLPNLSPIKCADISHTKEALKHYILFMNNEVLARKKHIIQQVRQQLCIYHAYTRGCQITKTDPYTTTLIYEWYSIRKREVQVGVRLP